MPDEMGLIGFSFMPRESGQETSSPKLWNHLGSDTYTTLTCLTGRLAVIEGKETILQYS